MYKNVLFRYFTHSLMLKSLEPSILLLKEAVSTGAEKMSLGFRTHAWANKTWDSWFVWFPGKRKPAPRPNNTKCRSKHLLLCTMPRCTISPQVTVNKWSNALTHIPKFTQAKPNACASSNIHTHTIQIHTITHTTDTHWHTHTTLWGNRVAQQSPWVFWVITITGRSALYSSPTPRLHR